jgi:hypothetical protein
MKRLSIALALAFFVAAPLAYADKSGPTLGTDKTKYTDGDSITFTGTNWESGEHVTIVYGQDGGDKSTLETIADSDGAFTVEGSMKAGEGGSPNYKATATGDISHGNASVQYGEGEPESDGSRLIQLESYWFDRLTFPTGKFNPGWVRNAAEQDKNVPRGNPKGKKKGNLSRVAASLNGNKSILSLSNAGFTSLGPQPEKMSGCNGCFDYGTTQGRVNTIAIDPTTLTTGSIVAYIGSVGGGVWKSANCCNANTTWSVVTDDPLIATTSIDTITIDPNDHNTIYAGTGDLNYGSFSMGSQGILKSTDAGAHWTVLGANVFGPQLPQPTAEFPQYQAVGKVRVDPNNSNRVVAGTKTGLYFSYDGGANWTGPCLTNTFTSMRQDITGLELTNMGGGVTRILAAIGVRGFATTVQFNLNQNGANGIYRGTVPSSGCPTDFTSIASNANGFVFGTAVTGSPYATGANMNAGNGVAISGTSGDQLGRIDIAIAPSNPQVIYAQVGSITPNNNAGCGNTNGCQLGVWASTNGGTSWTFMAGSAGGSLRNCANGNSSSNPGDYPQNWYDQGMAVDPNNADRLFIDTYDTWFATRTGTSFFNVTCGYNGSALSAHVVHTDHHALAFIPGSSSILLEGSDGGIFASSNANTASATTRPAWINMNTGLNTIEFYSGDISGNFVGASSPIASGGAQDNGPSSATFPGGATGPVQWQMGLGGDGFYSRIDPVGTGSQLRVWQGNNSGGLSRCVSNCTVGGAAWSSRPGAWSSDTQSFVLPFDLFHGGIPGGDDCDPAGATTGCGRLIAGTTRVWETITGAAGTTTWYITNNPSNQNMTKQTLGNRSFINQVKYSPRIKTMAILGTNDSNVWIGFNLGTGVAGQANWVNVTGGNATVPLRPVLGIALDPTTGTNGPIGYAAVGGFNGNSVLPGHIFRVVCTATCSSFVWTDKTGNLPDIPVDSIIVNPNFSTQVFAGTDFGLYYTDDITANPPVWFRFNAGLPNVMIWDMQIDRGSTALSLWTRSRGAYVWPLPSGPENLLPTTLNVAPATGTYGGTVNLSATLTSGGNPVASKSIAFAVNGASAGSALTNANGIATISNASLGAINAASYAGGVTATFTPLVTDTTYAGSNDVDSLTVGKRPITVSAVADAKTYDGNTSSTGAPSITPPLVNGDTSSFFQTFDTKNAGNSKTLTAAGSANDHNNGGNYDVNFVNNANGAITPLAITGSITASDKVYDATTSASIATRTLAGIIGPDDVAYAGGTATFADANVGSGKAVSATGLSLTGNDALNYTVNPTATTTASITVRPITVTANNQSKIFGGAEPALTYSITVGSLAGTDTFSGALTRDPGDTAGAYAINQGSLTAGSNYFLTFIGGSLVIGQATAHVTVAGYSGVYDGTAHGATGIATGVNGEDLSSLLNLGASFTNVPGGTASWTFAGNNDYAPQNGTSAIVITKAPLTVTANDAARLYSYPNPAFTAAYSGFKNGQTLATSDVTGSPLLTTTATPSSAAGNYTISATGGSLASNNYSLSFVDGTLHVYLSGIVGLDSVSIGSNKGIADSFDSTGSYASTIGSNALVLSNGLINIQGAKIYGSIVSSAGAVQLDPGSAVTGSVRAGTTISGTGTVGGTTSPNQPVASIAAPAVPDCGAGSDVKVTGGDTLTLPAGTYCFHSLSLTGNSTIRVTGKVIIRLTGELNATGGSFVNTTQIPSNLQIASSYAGANGVAIGGGTYSYLTVYAPKTSVTITGGSPFFGAALGKSLTVSGNSQVHYDVLLSDVWGALMGF